MPLSCLGTQKTLDTSTPSGRDHSEDFSTYFQICRCCYHMVRLECPGYFSTLWRKWEVHPMSCYRPPVYKQRRAGGRCRAWRHSGVQGLWNNSFWYLVKEGVASTKLQPWTCGELITSSAMIKKFITSSVMIMISFMFSFQFQALTGLSQNL